MRTLQWYGTGLLAGALGLARARTRAGQLARTGPGAGRIAGLLSLVQRYIPSVWVRGRCRKQISGGQVRLRPSTLYTALDRLRADELIGVDREEIVDGRLRRYYRLTPEGTRRLGAEAARLQAHATAALTRLHPAGGAAT